jgi:hypothetical protein
MNYGKEFQDSYGESDNAYLKLMEMRLSENVLT